MRLEDCIGCGLPVLELEGQFENLDSFYAGDAALSKTSGEWHVACLHADPALGERWTEARLANYVDVRRFEVLASAGEWTVVQGKRHDDRFAFSTRGDSLSLLQSATPRRSSSGLDLIYPIIRENYRLHLGDVETVTSIKEALLADSVYPLDALLVCLGITDKIVNHEALEGARFILDHELAQRWREGSGSLSARLVYGVQIPEVLLPHVITSGGQG